MEEMKKVCVLCILDNTNRSKLSVYIMEKSNLRLKFSKKRRSNEGESDFLYFFPELTIVRRHEVYRKKSSLRKKVHEQVENTKRSWSEKISVLLFLNVHSP